MLMVDRINELAQRMGISISTIEKTVGLSNGIIGKWRKQSPSCEKLKLVADYLNVSIDYLLTGKEHKTTALTPDEQELLDIYKSLSDTGKGQLKERAVVLAELEASAVPEQAESTSKDNIHIQTVRSVARSFDNAPPRIVTGDFSDILNAPDATDEY